MSSHEVAAVVPLSPWAVLEERIGYTFQRGELLTEALTHPSFSNEAATPVANNQRLEFLGDAVIDLIVSHNLMVRRPNAGEGELSRQRAALVSEKAFAAVARELGLGEMLRLGRGEAAAGGADKDSILADGLEAVCGAVYLDAGYDTVAAVVLNLFATRLEAVSRSLPQRDYKSLVQEVLQGTGRGTPTYRLKGATGPDHAKLFEAEILVGGLVIATGEGRTKKDAEHDAARAYYEMLLDTPEPSAAPSDDSATTTPT